MHIYLLSPPSNGRERRQSVQAVVDASFISLSRSLSLSLAVSISQSRESKIQMEKFKPHTNNSVFPSDKKKEKKKRCL
jgi:hypothetical protein